MTDGTTQLHIGADFIRTTLLNHTAQDQQKMHRAFRWAIAHEISHLCDPAFNRFGRTYNIRIVLDNVAQICCFMGLLSFMPGTSVFLGSANYTAIFGLSAAFIALKGLCITRLHRRFEYTADAMAARLVDDNDQQSMTLALTTMTTAIRSSITNPYAQATWPMLRLYGWFYQRGTTAKLFFLHPSMERRVKRLQKAQASR
jgi:Zn-dependent protease with chaperone function